MSRGGKRTVFRACPLCEAICGLEIGVEDGAVVSIRGDRDDPFSRGHICPKAVALQDVQVDPDRLRHPIQRTRGDGWERISWSSAFDAAAAGLRAVQQEHGRDAVGVFLGNPNVHSSGALLYNPLLLRALGTRSRFSATSVDQLPHHVAAYLMFGHQLLLPIPDLDRTAYLLVLGANPAVSNGSMMTAPGMVRRLKELRGRGGRLVVVDPRRTETARLADRHLFIRPGADGLLLAALMRTILAEHLEQPGRLVDLCSSLDRLRRAVAGFTPERVASATGIPPGEVQTLARELAGAPSAVVYGRFGVSTHAFGGICQWLINALNIVTGNLDRPGGAMFTKPAVDLLDRVGRGHLGRRRSRVRGLRGFGGELPAATLAEEILTEGPGRIRALLTLAGNPVLSTPNGRRLEQGLASLDFMVAVDLYLNETTRHAHLILPPTAPLEHDHYDLAFNLLAVRNVARYSPAVLGPDPDARHDWQILGELARRLDRGSLASRLKRRLITRLGPRRQLDLALRLGPYGARFSPFGQGLTLGKVAGAVHGLDLGPLEPSLPERLRTSDRRIELAPQPFLEDLARLLRLADHGVGGDPDRPPLRLIGRRQLRSNNSWMHNLPRLMRGKDRCTLLVHPEDAFRLGLATGRRVAVIGRAGRIEILVEVSEDVMPGVVSLPHGWGHDRPGTRLATAQRHPGASLNDVTDETEVDPLCGTAVLNGIPVRLEPVEQH